MSGEPGGSLGLGGSQPGTSCHFTAVRFLNSELCFWFPCGDDRLLRQLGFLYCPCQERNSPEDQVKSKARQLLKNLRLYFTVAPYTSHASTQEAYTNKRTVSALQSPAAINKEGWVLFFFLFSRKMQLYFFLTVQNLHRGRLGARLQSLGDLGLRGLSVTSEWRQEPRNPEPA